jgi:hypothetical protein
MSRKLIELLRELKLPGFAARHGELAEKAEKSGWGFERYLQALAEAELDQRHQKRLERLLRASKLPMEKTLATLDTAPANACHPGWPMGMGPEQYPYEPPRIAPKGTLHGRVAQIKAAGNGVVPQQAEMALSLLLAPALPYLQEQP